MAVQAGTDLSYGTVGVREDLADIIYDISPSDTPFMSMIGRTSARNTLHEWQTDQLRTAAANAQLEGDDAAYSAPTRTVRVGNYTQISRETVRTSRTQDKTNKAGRGRETQRNVLRRSQELKLDMERALLANQAGVAGDSATPRQLAGMPTWIQTNFQAGAGGSPSGHVSGVPSAATVAGADANFVFADVQTAMQTAYEHGAKPSVLMVGTALRGAISDVASFGQGVAEHRVQVNQPRSTFIPGSIDVLVTDYGNLRVMPNRVLQGVRPEDAWLVDPSMASVAFLDSFMVKDLAITGDVSAAKLLVVEYTLRVNNEQAFALLQDRIPTP